MRRKWLLGTLLTVIGLIGFAVWAQSEMSDEERATADFESLVAAPYTDWPFEPGVPEGYYIGQQPHGLILRSFVNDIALEAIGSDAEAFAEGSIIVKENHVDDHTEGDAEAEAPEPQTAVPDFEGNLESLTFMVKVPGYNPEAGDWFWAKMQPDGTIDAAGQPAGCIGCHGQVADNDYVFNAPLAAGN